MMPSATADVEVPQKCKCLYCVPTPSLEDGEKPCNCLSHPTPQEEDESQEAKDIKMQELVEELSHFPRQFLAKIVYSAADHIEGLNIHGYGSMPENMTLADIFTTVCTYASSILEMIDAYYRHLAKEAEALNIPDGAPGLLRRAGHYESFILVEQALVALRVSADQAASAVQGVVIGDQYLEATMKNMYDLQKEAMTTLMRRASLLDGDDDEGEAETEA